MKLSRERRRGERDADAIDRSDEGLSSWRFPGASGKYGGDRAEELVPNLSRSR